MSRKTRTPKLKLQVAIEAAQTNKRVIEIASEYDVSPSQVVEWKKQLLEYGASVFYSSRPWGDADDDVECLQDEVEQLTIEVNWLKQKLGIPQL